MSPDLYIALAVIAVSTVVGFWAAHQDRKATIPLSSRIDKLEGLILALRHYISTLISWGTHTNDPPPRDPPDPPDKLMGGD